MSNNVAGSEVKKTYLLIVPLILVLFLLSNPANAAIVNLDMILSFNGTSPEASTPWLMVQFDDQDSPGTVNLTITAANISGTEKIHACYFNLDPIFDEQDIVNMSFSAPTKTGSFDD